MTNGPYIVDETCLVFAKNIEAENEKLRAENEKLRAAFRVNMLRAFPNMSHEEIDAEIEAAIVGEKE
jgi:hypothetical protein